MTWTKRFNGDQESIKRQARRYALHAEQARRDGNALLLGMVIATIGFLAVIATIVISTGM